MAEGIDSGGEIEKSEPQSVLEASDLGVGNLVQSACVSSCGNAETHIRPCLGDELLQSGRGEHCGDRRVNFEGGRWRDCCCCCEVRGEVMLGSDLEGPCMGCHKF